MTPGTVALTSTRTEVQFVGPSSVEVTSTDLAEPAPDEVRVRTTASAVSPGTELLIYRGKAPDTLSTDASIESLSGELAFPLTYGYAAVGEVVATGGNVDASWRGTRVFSFQPHASHFNAAPEALVPIPDRVTDEDAVLIPSLETAVTLLMDGRPMIGERIVVFGQGIIGLLTTALLSSTPHECLYTVEPTPSRQRWSEELGADASFDSDAGLDALADALHLKNAEATDAAEGPYEGADLIYEVSGHAEVLDQCLSLAGFDGRIIVGSWYGTKPASLDLGGRFHRSRMRLSSSQVSTIAPRYRGRWTKDRRMSHVVSLLSDISPSQLINHEVPLRDAPELYRRLDEGDEDILQPIFRYDAL